MKTLLAIAALILLVPFASADNRFTTDPRWDGVKETAPGSEPITLRQGGDDIEHATIIPGVPFTDAGTTCGYVNDYEETCPWGPSFSPDVVYVFTPQIDEYLYVDLCDSYYDTKLYIYQDECTPGFPYVCNDDACSGPNYPYPYLSSLGAVPFYGGHNYYIVVDGYGGECGSYVLDIYQDGCWIECPEGAIPEGETGCGPGYVDDFNGGCGSNPTVYQMIECDADPVVYCGASGTWQDNGSWRDTDWYEITIAETKTLTICAIAEFPLLVFLLDGNPTPGPDPCEDDDLILDYDYAYPCNEICFTRTFAPGIYWIWVGPSVFEGVECDFMNRYTLSIEGYCGGTAAESATWGRVKGIFR
ncbi:MAG: hypothetical protein ABIK65_08865 [Candidatus Eisenbacteria bacterium]